MSADRRSGRAPSPGLPGWAVELVTLYESHAANQFILHGNVHDRFLLPLGDAAALGSLADFLLRVLLPRFDVVLSYDLGNGIRVEKGERDRSPGGRTSRRLRSFRGAPRDAVEVADALPALLREPRTPRPRSVAGGRDRARRGSGRAAAGRRAPLRPQRARRARARVGASTELAPAPARHVPPRREPERPAPAAGPQPARGAGHGSAPVGRRARARTRGPGEHYPVALGRVRRPRRGPGAAARRGDASAPSRAC